MREASHVADGNRIADAIGRNLEDVAMRLGRQLHRGLLTRQPRSPRRWTTGAVADGPTQTVARVDRFTFVRVELDRRRAATGGEVIRRSAEGSAGTVLMIANKTDTTATCC